MTEPQFDTLIVATCLAGIWLLYRFVLFTRRQGGNTELWGTVFESISHYTQPQGPLKEPGQHNRKELREAGDPHPETDRKMS